MVPQNKYTYTKYRQYNPKFFEKLSKGPVTFLITEHKTTYTSQQLNLTYTTYHSTITIISHSFQHEMSSLAVKEMANRFTK